MKLLTVNLLGLTARFVKYGISFLQHNDYVKRIEHFSKVAKKIISSVRSYVTEKKCSSSSRYLVPARYIATCYGDLAVVKHHLNISMFISLITD